MPNYAMTEDRGGCHKLVSIEDIRLIPLSKT